MAHDLDKRIARRLRILRTWCRKQNVELTPGDEVPEEAAGHIVGYRRGTDTLAVQRAEGRLPAVLRVRRLGRMYLYDLHSCARFIEEGFDAMLDENVTEVKTRPARRPVETV